MTSWVTPPTSIAELSADGRHVLFGGYVHRTNPDWLATVRKWLRLPDPPPLVIEASLLDSETLTLVAPFRIPAEQQRLGVFRFTTDGRYLVFTDGHVVEHYALPLRSWLTSALWAGIAPLTLIAIVSTWQFWRRRKRDTISPTPPTANVPEVSDAKT
jgi:hypothetical protein